MRDENTFRDDWLTGMASQVHVVEELAHAQGVTYTLVEKIREELEEKRRKRTLSMAFPTPRVSAHAHCPYLASEPRGLH